MSVLSYGEEKGLQPFIERLTDGQKADISKKFEIYHNTGRLKVGAAKAARVQFAKSSDAESEGEGDEPPHSDAGEDSEDPWRVSQPLQSPRCSAERDCE